MVNTSHQKSYHNSKAKKSSFNLKKYLLSYDPPPEDETETVIEYLDEWNKASIGSKYQNLPAAKKKYIIRDIIFQRLAVALSLISVDDLQLCVDEYTELKEEQSVTLYDFLIEKNILAENVIDCLLNFENPFDHSPLIPGYKIIDSLGEGGMGAVFLGEQIATKEKFAIKIFAPPVSDVSTEIARFKRECKVAMKLDSPYIIKSYASGDFYGMYYLVMEYIDGEPLDKKLSKRKRLYIEESLEIFEKLLLGMCEAWNRNFVHRDIKPSNILIKEDGTVKICDLGLAKALDCDEKLTETGSVFGTPQYIAPERFLGDNVDYRIDVYALGITLYEMLTGHVPFTGSSYLEICQKHLYDIPPSSEIAFGVRIPKNITCFLLQLLSKKPGHRCKNPTELMDNFYLVQRGKNPKGFVSYYKEKRRKKMEKGLIIANVFVISACVLIYFYQEHKRNQEERMLIEQQMQEEQSKTALEKQKILAEKKILAEEHSKIQEELEQQRLAEEIKSREQKELEKQRLQEQKKQEFISLVKSSLGALDFEKCGQQIAEMEKNFPESKEVEETRSLLGKVVTAHESILHQDKDAIVHIQSLIPQLDSSIIAQMMEKTLKMVPYGQKEFVLTVWLQAPQNTHSNILSALIKENNIDWLRHAFIEMPGMQAKLFYPIYLKIDVKDATQLKKIRMALYYLIYIDKKFSSLEKMLNTTDDNQFMIKVFHYASLPQKKKIAANMHIILQKLSEKNIHAITKQLYTNIDPRISFLFLQKLKTNTSKIVAVILFDIIEHSQYLKIRKLALEFLVEHKHSSYLQKNITNLIEEKQLAILNNLEKNTNSVHILIALATSSFPATREETIKKIADWDEERGISIIYKMLLQDEYFSVRKEAAIALGKISSPKALLSLIDAIELTDDFVTGKTILENISKKNNKVAANAIIQIILERPEYRRYAYEQLPAFSAEVTVPIITHMLGELGPTEARLMIYSLEKIGVNATLSLVDILQEADQFYLQKATIKALGNIGSLESVPVLLEMLSDRRAKRYATQALEQIVDNLPENDPQKIKILQTINNK